MKNIILFLICLLFFSCSNGDDETKKNGPVAFEQATASANFSARHAHRSVVFNNKIWIVGGGFESDVWCSIDGRTWSLENISADFTKYFGHQAIVFDDKIWVIGGHSANKKKNDVWCSEDGKEWKLATRSAGFSPRIDHSCVVYNNKIWVIGGVDSRNQLHNDVWNSNDGKNWKLATDSAAFSPRINHTSVVFDNKIWVIAGEDKEGRKNDIWCSEDGKEWIEKRRNAEFPKRTYHTTVVYDGRIWIIGGSGYDAFLVYKNDIWFSNDGISWQKIKISSGFSKRYSHASVVFDDKIWVIGGRGGKNVGDFKNDVWFSRDILKQLNK